PKTLTPVLLELSSGVMPGGEPVFIEISEDPHARRDYCDENVDHLVKQHGGQAVMGWALWEMRPKKDLLWIEAERHVVWRNRDGQLVDVTPDATNERRRLFLADPNAGNENVSV